MARGGDQDRQRGLMSIRDGREDRIDFDRVVFDPEYRRSVIARLNTDERGVDGIAPEGGTPSGAIPLKGSSVAGAVRPSSPKAR